jgi:PAS domain S-box-containing protein
MDVQSHSIENLLAEIDELRQQLTEANDTIEAIRTGQIDAIVVEGDNGHQLYTLRTADQAYRVFIEKMTEGAVTINSEGIILYCNTQFASMVSQPISNVIGMPFDTFVAPSHVSVFRSVFELCWSRDCKEEVYLRTSGRDIPVLLSLTTIELEHSTTLSIIVTDLSTQKKTQQLLEANNTELARMNQALELSNNDLQQFASVASHDLQEPLRKIQMFSNLLIERNAEALPEDSKKYLEKIIVSAGRMKSLIIDVLNYSRLSARDNEHEWLDLNEIVQELLEDFELIIQDKNARITVGELPSINGNKGQIRQAFQNILSNALKFSKRDVTPEIRIDAKCVAEKSFDSPVVKDGAWCLIRISDNGIGFEEKYLAHIFALFERLHPKDRYEGTGIGLAITKKIIEKHNGMIIARSEPGKGAEFLLLLPAR